MGSARIGAGTLSVRVEGYDVPGRSCAPADVDDSHDNVQVGVQRRNEVVDLVPGDAEAASWTFEVTTRLADDGTHDFPARSAGRTRPAVALRSA